MSNIASPYHFLRIFIFASLFLLLPIISLAQERPATSTPSAPVMVVANINISEAKILSQAADGILRVVSTITNNGTETQSDIRIGLDIVKKTDKGQTIVDSMVSDQVLSLAPGESLQQELQYPAQSFLSGEYEVWVIGRTTGGVMLGLSMAGKTTFFSADTTVEIIPDSCSLQVDGDKKSYTLVQGVDVAAEEILSFSCTLENHGTAAVTVIPTFSTYRRTTYGEPVAVAMETPVTVTLTANEKKKVTFVIPKATVPQAYDVSIALKDQSSQKQISNKVIAHYVLRGASATIQSLLLDPSSYTEGSPLSARLFWTPSADQFPGSRAGAGTTLPTVVVKMTILDGNGIACINPIEKNIAATDANPLVLQTTTIADCVSPQVSVSLMDEAGKVLDSRTFASAIMVDEMPVSIDDSLGNKMTALIVFIGLLLLIGLSFFVRKERIRKISLPPVDTFKSFFFLVLISAGVFMGAGEAKALTFTGAYPAFDGSGFDNIYSNTLWGEIYTVNTDKNTYAPGETITLSGSIFLAGCSNWSYSAYMTMTLNGSTNISGSGPAGTAIYGTGYLTAPATPGSYNISVSTCNSYGCTSGSLPITVAAASVNGACNMTAPNSCSSGTLGINALQPNGSYQWYCNGLNGGANSNLCYYVPPTPPQTSAPVNGSCNMSAPNACATGSLGINALQPNGSYHWYCNGLNGGANSNLCYYVPPTTLPPAPATPPAPVAPPAPTYYNGHNVTISANPNPVPYNTSTYLSWNSVYMTDCTASGDWSGAKTVHGGTGSWWPGFNTGNLTSSKTYTLSCYGSNGAVRGTASVVVNVLPAPVIPVVPTLPTTPIIPTVPGTPTAPTGLVVTAQACSTGANFLDWSDVANAVSYSIYNNATGAWIGNSVGSNYNHVGNLSTNYSYFVRANNSAGTQSSNSSVASGVTAGACAGEPAVSPSIEIILDPDLIRSGNTANVRVGVTSEFDTTCILEGVLGNSITINHIGGATKVIYPKTTRPLTSAQVVSLTCSIDGFPAFTSSTNARIKVIPINEEI